MVSADERLNMCAELVSNVIVVNNTNVGACGTLRSSPPYSFDEYIRRWLSHLQAHWFAIFPAGALLAMAPSSMQHGATHAGWWTRLNYCGGRCAVDHYTDGNFKDI